MAIADLNTTDSGDLTDGQAEIASSALGIIENAIAHCETMTALRGRDQIAEALRVENPAIHGYFRYSIAQQIAEYLSGLDETVVSVYTHSYGDAEEEGEDKSTSLSAPINLILHVRRKTAALHSIVAYLDRQLLESYKQLIAPEGKRIASILDIQLVDDEDIHTGRGFGVVLRSSYSKPVRLWPE
ncbi:MAG: hypothetical protein ACOX87_03380 [Chloroflexota bacterium]|jgi:hypothetical protein